MDRNACARLCYRKSFRLSRKRWERTIHGKKAQKICREDAQQDKSDKPSPESLLEETLHQNTPAPSEILYPTNWPVCKELSPRADGQARPFLTQRETL